MLIENSIINCDDEAIETLREIADKTTYRIIIAIIHSPKTAAQICAEINFLKVLRIRGFGNYKRKD